MIFCASHGHHRVPRASKPHIGWCRRGIRGHPVGAFWCSDRHTFSNYRTPPEPNARVISDFQPPLGLLKTLCSHWKKVKDFRQKQKVHALKTAKSTQVAVFRPMRSCVWRYFLTFFQCEHRKVKTTRCGQMEHGKSTAAIPMVR